MARGLENYPDIESPDSDYPDGNIKDDTGSNDGTPVDQEVYSDIHQVFAKLLRLSEITASGNPENEYSGFQYVDALEYLFGNNRQRVFIDGIAASTVVDAVYNPQVVVHVTADPSQNISMVAAETPIVSKVKVANYSYSPVSVSDSLGGTVNGAASPFVMFSRSVAEFLYDNAGNWSLASYYVMP